MDHRAVDFIGASSTFPNPKIPTLRARLRERRRYAQVSAVAPRSDASTRDRARVPHRPRSVPQDGEVPEVPLPRNARSRWTSKSASDSSPRAPRQAGTTPPLVPPPAAWALPGGKCSLSTPLNTRPRPITTGPPRTRAACRRVKCSLANARRSTRSRRRSGSASGKPRWNRNEAEAQCVTMTRARPTAGTRVRPARCWTRTTNRSRGRKDSAACATFIPIRTSSGASRRMRRSARTRRIYGGRSKTPTGASRSRSSGRWKSTGTTSACITSSPTCAAMGASTDSTSAGARWAIRTRTRTPRMRRGRTTRGGRERATTSRTPTTRTRATRATSWTRRAGRGPALGSWPPRAGTSRTASPWARAPRSCAGIRRTSATWRCRSRRRRRGRLPRRLRRRRRTPAPRARPAAPRARAFPGRSAAPSRAGARTCAPPSSRRGTARAWSCSTRYVCRSRRSGC